MLNKITLILFKYIPVISIIGALLNNIIYLCDSNVLYFIPYYIDGFFGVSVMLLILLFLISFKFKYCTWHRILLFNILFNVTIAILDSLHLIKIQVTSLLLLFIISAICFSLATVIHLINVRKGYHICVVRHSTSARFDQFLLSFIKWLPLLQLFVFLFSNTICYLDFDMRIYYITDFFIGNSIISTLFLYLLSVRFNFSYAHKSLIIVNFINFSIAFFDANIHTLPLSDSQLYITYYIAPCIYLLIVLYTQIKKCLYEHQTQTIA